MEREPSRRGGTTVEIEERPTIEADANQLRRLFQDLISNSLKFRKKDPCVIKIYSKPANAGEGRKHWQIYVEDNGIGFEDKYADRIFTLFERLHGRSAYEGCGMGLAICRRIAEHHGGSIVARGRPGEGATFVITLPARRS